MESAPRPFVRLLTVAVVLLCLAVVGQVLLWRLDNPTGFDGDESDHALWAATVYLDLAQGNLPAFLRHLYAQNRFPPLYSLLQLPFVAALGTTPLAHRVTATFWLLVLCAVTYAAVAAGRRDAWAGACLAVLLVAGCPRLLALATMVYFESAGFALMLLTYALYLQARRHAAASPASRGVAPPRRDPALWAAAACYFLLWFLKWQYGLLVGAVLIAHLLIVHRFRWPGLRHDRAGWTVLLPAWAAVALWLANPYQLREFLLYLTGVPKPEGLYARLVEGYLLQGRFLLTDWSATLPAALLTAGGLVYGLCRLRRPDTLLYTLAAGAALIVSANVRGGAESRIMMWVLPPLWVLVGLGVNEGLGALRAPRGCLLRPRCAWGGRTCTRGPDSGQCRRLRGFRPPPGPAASDRRQRHGGTPTSPRRDSIAGGPPLLGGRGICGHPRFAPASSGVGGLLGTRTAAQCREVGLPGTLGTGGTLFRRPARLGMADAALRAPPSALALALASPTPGTSSRTAPL